MSKISKKVFGFETALNGRHIIIDVEAESKEKALSTLQGSWKFIGARRLDAS
jgi:hypothetical protein